MSDRGPWTIQRLRVPLGFVVGALYLWLARPQPRLLAAGALVALVDADALVAACQAIPALEPA